MIDFIQFHPDSTFIKDYYDGENPITSLKNISQINLFVGPNNSGKSRFLRNLAKQFYKYRTPAFDDKVRLPYDETRGISLTTISSIDFIKTLDKILPKLKKISLSLHDQWLSSLNKKEYFDEKTLIYSFNDWSILSHPRSKNMTDFNKSELIDLEQIKEEIKAHIDSIIKVPANRGLKTTYVPSFRSLRKFSTIKGNKKISHQVNPIDFETIQNPILGIRPFLDYFVDAVKDESNIHAAPKYIPTFPDNNIFSGESLFDDIYTLRNGNEEKRQIIKGFELFLSEKFFNNKNVELNAIEHDNIKDVFVKIGEEKEFPIFHLGDGIQAIIILIFPLFYFRKYNHIILYEEPELYLHPGMQRIFIEALRLFPLTCAFIVTHSNHILETSLDNRSQISIFSFEKSLINNQPRFHMQTFSTPDLSLLNLLGVRNSSIFLSNCCIWIEGISDRIYLKKYLELYMKEKEKAAGAKIFHEDLHFSFLEFGGNQIVHYNFDELEQPNSQIKAKRITNRLLLIHDLDENKSERHKVLASQLSKNYIPLPVREIENLLTPSILLNTLNHYRKRTAKALTSFGLDQSQYAFIPFGNVLQPLIDDGTLKKITMIVSKKATPILLNKAEFALKATSFMNNWDDMSDDAKSLIEKVYLFIHDHNKF
ncbi:MAG TPA: AAA family ATPase [Daejeonella sp.]|uniref:AAA family ATPase n=1 Tax=Daejeonella sp. TaxID=2805397 RepID=UPI002EDA85BF